MISIKSNIFKTTCMLFHKQFQGCGFEPPKLTADFAMTRVSIVVKLLNYNFLICAICFLHLQAVDTIGNCQRLAFTVGVAQHMHKITNL